ncbi:MAG: hypothetical protein Q9200_003394 [Gallowayella weberi]
MECQMLNHSTAPAPFDNRNLRLSNSRETIETVGDHEHCEYKNTLKALRPSSYWSHASDIYSAFAPLSRREAAAAVQGKEEEQEAPKDRQDRNLDDLSFAPTLAFLCVRCLA